jgi:hypothetical protein
MYQLICTSYNQTENGLVLRNNWTEESITDEKLVELINKWQLPNDFKYPSINSVSKILEGKMELDNVVVHVRIIRFN